MRDRNSFKKVGRIPFSTLDAPEIESPHFAAAVAADRLKTEKVRQRHLQRRRPFASSFFLFFFDGIATHLAAAAAADRSEPERK
jgi:hypothetical protein